MERTIHWEYRVSQYTVFSPIDNFNVFILSSSCIAQRILLILVFSLVLNILCAEYLNDISQ